MTVLITLTVAGVDTGPFDLYSNLDGYTTSFETGIALIDLTSGYTSSLVPDFTTLLRVQSTGDCINFVDIPLTVETTTTTTTTEAPTTTTTTTESPSYCVSWIATNDSNIKMSTSGFIDFTAMLAGRTIDMASSGTITGYLEAGNPIPFVCSIPMTFTTALAEWDEDGLPVITDGVLTSLIYTVNIIFNNATEFDIIDGQTNAIVTTPPQLSSEYNDCI